jgi:hypothetical protein
MLGRVIKGQNNLPVARIMACVEVALRVGPASDFSQVSAFVGALLDWPMGRRLSGVCDNRDFFQLRTITSKDVRLVEDALRVACGIERTAGVDWATVSYFDTIDSAAVPGTYVSCALGRCADAEKDVALSLVIGIADGSPWDYLFQLSDSLATMWPGVWCSMTVGNRFCSLDYNGFPFAHQAIHRMARRMPAVDIGDTLGIHTAQWTRRLRTVGWTTFVNAELGRQCEIRRPERLDRIDLLRLACGGLCVRLRDEPTDGEAPETEVQAYIHADSIFRPVRASDGIAFLPPWTEEASRDWLGRWQPGGAASMFLATPD